MLFGKKNTEKNAPRTNVSTMPGNPCRVGCAGRALDDSDLLQVNGGMQKHSMEFKIGGFGSDKPGL